MRKLLIFLFLLNASFSWSQDSVMVLTYDNFIAQVLENHPTVFRANIVESMGNSAVTESRGAFDPMLIGKMNQKYFDDKQYYSHFNGGLKIPTWFGVSAEAGYDNNSGVYLNPENRLPTDGMWYAGLRVELGNGLIIDKRRAAFKKAKLSRESSQLEKQMMNNQLKQDASLVYWNWQRAFQEMNIYQEALENATTRFEATKRSVVFGDKPAIDTVEASIAVQNRYNSLLKATNVFRNAELELEVYLWSKGFIPLELENTLPEATNENDLVIVNQLDSVVLNHPYLKINEIQLSQKQIDLQLKREQLKPKLTLKYNLLSEPVNNNPVENLSPSNYTWGGAFAYPIFTRKERGGVQLAKLELQDQELKYKMNAIKLENKIKSTLNDYYLALEQLEVSKRLVESNQQMYDAELRLFNLGESSIFMINSRENSWLKSKTELIIAENKVKTSITKINFLLFQ